MYFVEAVLAMIRGSKECLIQHLVNMFSFVRLMNQFTIEISSLTQIAGVLCRNVTKSFLQKANLHPIKPLQLHGSKFSALLCDDIQSWLCWRPLRPLGQVLRSCSAKDAKELKEVSWTHHDIHQNTLFVGVLAPEL